MFENNNTENTAENNQTTVTLLKPPYPWICIQFNGVSVYLSRHRMESFTAKTSEVDNSITIDERLNYLAQNRAKNFLKYASFSKYDNECFFVSEPLVDGDTLFLIATEIEQGRAAIYDESINAFVSNVSIKRRSFRVSPLCGAGWIRFTIPESSNCFLILQEWVA